MVSVLFVDDNIDGLRLLRETFAQAGSSWETSFVAGPGLALEKMEGAPVDAVVASTRLSGMSTAEFFKLTKSAYPRTARIALSDPGDRGAMLSALPVVNQCLSKACGPEVLARVVDKTTKLQDLLFNPATRRVLSGIGPLPSLPSNLLALDTALSDEECSLGHVADVISRDVALVAKVLKLVNSSFFGLRSQVNDVRQAVAYLGVETLRDFAMASEAFSAFTKNPAVSDSWLASFNAHAISVADIAGRLVRTTLAQCGASVAGMLHDIGELVVAQRDPALLQAVAADVENGCPADEAETRHIGTTVPVIGGYLLSVWGVGHHIVEAVTYQRDERAGPPRDPELADVLRAADYTATRSIVTLDPPTASATGASAGHYWTCQSGRAELDAGYMERVGLLSALNVYDRGRPRQY